MGKSEFESKVEFFVTEIQHHARLIKKIRHFTFQKYPPDNL